MFAVLLVFVDSLRLSMLLAWTGFSLQRRCSIRPFTPPDTLPHTLGTPLKTHAARAAGRSAAQGARDCGGDAGAHHRPPAQHAGTFVGWRPGACLGPAAATAAPDWQPRGRAARAVLVAVFAASVSLVVLDQVQNPPPPPNSPPPVLWPRGPCRAGPGRGGQAAGDGLQGGGGFDRGLTGLSYRV